MNENEFQNFQIQKKKKQKKKKNRATSSVVPDSRSVSTISYIVQFFSGAAHDAMYWPTVFLPSGGQETTPKNHLPKDKELQLSQVCHVL